MCVTEIWTYRECGCHYHHPLPCHPSFTPSATIPRRLKAGPHLSNASSSSERSVKSIKSSTFGSNDRFSRLSRQCSIRHTVNKNFLEPICDDCLLGELGLQPELGPILGGRDLKEGLHGEEWLLESSIEISVEEPDESEDLATSHVQDVEETAADADDEEEVRGRSGRRRGMDISRDALGISLNLSADERECLALFREELCGTVAEDKNCARASVETQKERRRLTPYWPQQFQKGPSRMARPEERALSISLGGDGSVGSSLGDSWTPPPVRHRLRAKESEPKDMSFASHTSSRGGRDASCDVPSEIIPLYESNPKPDNKQVVGYASWSEHLHADLQEGRATREHRTAGMLEQDALQRGGRSPSSIPTSPQTTAPFHSASWPPCDDVQPLNIPSSEFDKDEITTPPNPTTTPPAPQLPPNRHCHTHTTSVDSIISTSTFRTANSSSSPSPPNQINAITTAPPTPTPIPTTQLAIHPLSTALTINTPQRPTLTPRTSSLRSPPASSPLLHSTPPLHQSPTSLFTCVHERWAFKGCGCDGPSWVRSCVCDDNDANTTLSNNNLLSLSTTGSAQDESQSEEDAKDECRATDPLVRTRWFFNASCEACSLS